MASSGPVQIVWFKRDLRVSDHAALSAASALGPVLPLYMIEPDYWRQDDVSGRQYDFLVQCLEGLNTDLQALGSPLCIRVGDAVDILANLTRQFPGCTLWSHEETGNAWTYRRDLAVAQALRELSVEWNELSQGGVIRRLPSRDGWAGNWQRHVAVPVAGRPVLQPAPGVRHDRVPELQELGLQPERAGQPGGRRAAERVLEGFLIERGEFYRSAMSSPLDGAAACSRLSPHLALGVMSVREVYHRLQHRRTDIPAGAAGRNWRGSLKSFRSRLQWRDHFMQKLEDQPSIEFENLHPGLSGLERDAVDEARMAAWREGQTGIPFVDACMRSLNRTGWLNFRMRAMLVSFASYHLWQPWQASGQHLARMFLDYEPGIHWSQVQMQSGTTGINTIRIYNPVKQGRDQDPDGVFIRQWCPELADIPDSFLHEPWKWSARADGAQGAYPAPIVDVAAAARAARDRVHAARKAPGFRDEAASIVRKHASRSGRRRSPARSAGKPSNQLTLGL